jgi:hypothetical protein
VGVLDVVAQHARHERRPETGRDAPPEPCYRQEPLSQPVGGLTDSAIAPARGIASRSPLHTGAPTTTPFERARCRPSRTRVKSGADPPKSCGDNAVTEPLEATGLYRGRWSILGRNEKVLSFPRPSSLLKFVWWPQNNHSSVPKRHL